MLLARGRNAFGNYSLPNGDEPSVLLDFKNGVYLVDSVDTPIEDIVHTSGGWAGDFNPDDVTPGVGFVSPDDNYNQDLSFIEDAPAYNLLLQPFTFLVDFKLGETQDASCGFRYRDVDTSSNTIRLVMSGPNGYDIAAVFIDAAGVSHINHLDNDIFTTTDSYRVAFTVAFDRVSYSVNGGATVSYTGDIEFAFDTSDAVVCFISGTGSVLEKLGFYPVQADADLPMLSTP